MGSRLQLDCTHIDPRPPPSLCFRLFLFDEAQHHFTLLCQSSHHNGCILKVLIHLHPTTSTPHSLHSPHTSDFYPSAPPPFLLSAATDGRIAVWDLRPVVQWLLEGVGEEGPSSHDRDSASPQRSAEMSESNAGVKKAAMKSGKNWLGELDHDHFQAVTREQALEQSDDDDSGEEDDEDNNDENQGQPTRVQQNMTKAQYLGDSPVASLQQTLAAARLCVKGEPLVSRTCSEGVSQEQDGCLSGWSPNQEIRAHQSGVNSLHMKSLAGGQSGWCGVLGWFVTCSGDCRCRNQGSLCGEIRAIKYFMSLSLE